LCSGSTYGVLISTRLPVCSSRAVEKAAQEDVPARLEGKATYRVVDMQAYDLGVGRCGKYISVLGHYMQ